MERTVDEGKWAEWRRRLARHGEWVGLVAAFCEREGVSVAAFYQCERCIRDVVGVAGAEPFAARRGNSVVATPRLVCGGEG